jgi:prevent-host-death family protein
MKQIALSEIKDDLSRFLREAEGEEIIITRHGKPAGLLLGFASEDDWLDYRLEHDPRFLQRIESARSSIRAGRGVRIEDAAALFASSEPPNQRGAANRSQPTRSRRSRKSSAAGSGR